MTYESRAEIESEQYCLCDVNRFLLGNVVDEGVRYVAAAGMKRIFNSSITSTIPLS